jgi:phage terminase large subunit GpA-like protein
MRIMTVTTKPKPHPSAISLNCFLLMDKRIDSFEEEKSSSDVTIRIRAVTASQRLMSDADKGRFIWSSPVL